jgi:hypothetical protein
MICPEFIEENADLVEPGNAMGFISDNGGQTYNRCHCKCPCISHLYNMTLIQLFLSTVWSNFEIGDLDFWRGEAYMKFFEFLDSKGGFYYERWGDAPVHSIGAALFAKKEQIHFFNDIGALYLVSQSYIIKLLTSHNRLPAQPLPTLPPGRSPLEGQVLVQPKG